MPTTLLKVRAVVIPILQMREFSIESNIDSLSSIGKNAQEHKSENRNHPYITTIKLLIIFFHKFIIIFQPLLLLFPRY